MELYEMSKYLWMVVYESFVQNRVYTNTVT